MAVTEKSGFFDSVDGDRLYSAADFNNLLGSMYEDGIRYNYQWYLPDNEQLKVSVVSGLTVEVAHGKAVWHGRWYELTGFKQITLDAGESNYPRIDAIYVHFDSTERRAYIDVQKGAPGPNPEWTTGIGLLLATARIEAGATTISELVDRRDGAFCGFSTLIDAPNMVQAWEYTAPSSKKSVTSITVGEIEAQIRALPAKPNKMFTFNARDIFFVTVNGLDLPRASIPDTTPPAGTWCIYSGSIRIGTDAAPNKGDVVRIRMIRRNTIGDVDWI